MKMSMSNLELAEALTVYLSEHVYQEHVKVTDVKLVKSGTGISLNEIQFDIERLGKTEVGDTALEDELRKL